MLDDYEQPEEETNAQHLQKQEETIKSTPIPTTATSLPTKKEVPSNDQEMRNSESNRSGRRGGFCKGKNLY